jgi:hypothetical protein
MNIIFQSQRPPCADTATKKPGRLSDHSLPAIYTLTRGATNALLTVMVLGGLLLAPALYAQTTAQLTGTVQDSSGGVIPGAQVTLINDATGNARALETKGHGLYAFLALAPTHESEVARLRGATALLLQRHSIRRQPDHSDSPKSSRKPAPNSQRARR